MVRLSDMKSLFPYTFVIICDRLTHLLDSYLSALGAPLEFWFQILLPFLVHFQIGKINIERCIRDLGFAGEQKHRYNLQDDGAQEHNSGNGCFVKIGRNHRGERQHKGHHRRTRLDDADEAQPVAQGG